MKKTVKDMVDEAMAEVETISVAEAIKRQDDDAFVIVDIRDVRELDREGMIPGAFHAPRGMLEFWVDPEARITRTSSRRARPSSSIAGPVSARRWQPRRCGTWGLRRSAISKAASPRGPKPAPRSPNGHGKAIRKKRKKKVKTGKIQ